jgi:CRP-like cAMP-binding protein
MTSVAQHQSRNLLLSVMKGDDYSLLQPYLKRVGLIDGDVLARPGDAISTICFPEGAVTALLSITPNGGLPEADGRTAVGLIGREGMVGVSHLLGASHWTHEVLVRAQTSSGLKIAADRLLAACRCSPSLHSLLLRYAGNYLLQVGRTCTSNSVCSVEQRMARWILLYHDRVEGDEFPITHKEFAIMLGVRRASATEALHILEGRQLVRSLRGQIVIRDRQGLEELAGSAYGDVEEDYRRTLAPFGKSGRTCT